ncbi:MAG: glycosyltransferase family 2 protein [Bacillota bacterium]
MKVAVAFLCYNESSSRYLDDFLPSLEKAVSQVNSPVFIYAGDNSDDGRHENQKHIAKYNEIAHFPVIWLPNEYNLGFAAGFNRLIYQAEADGCEAFLMLNPDILVDSGMVQHLLSRLEGNEELACTFPLLYRWDFGSKEKTSVIDTCGIGLKPGLRFFDIGQGGTQFPQNVAAIGPSGAAAMFRLSSLNKVKEGQGFFDERFFMYKEDCDLAYRLYQKGLESALVPEAIAYHDRSATSKRGLLATFTDWRQRGRRTRTWSFVNQHLIFIKHFRSEPIFSQLLVLVYILLYGIFSLFLAQFLIKSYPLIYRHYRHLD